MTPAGAPQEHQAPCVGPAAQALAHSADGEQGHPKKQNQSHSLHFYPGGRGGSAAARSSLTEKNDDDLLQCNIPMNKKNCPILPNSTFLIISFRFFEINAGCFLLLSILFIKKNYPLLKVKT